MQNSRLIKISTTGTSNQAPRTKTTQNYTNSKQIKRTTKKTLKLINHWIFILFVEFFFFDQIRFIGEGKNNQKKQTDLQPSKVRRKNGTR